MLVALPSQTGKVRWALDERVPAGCSWVPGPGDTTVVARVDLNDAGWTDFTARAAASGAKTRLVVGEAMAEGIFDSAELVKLPMEGGERVVEGEQIDLNKVTKGPYDGRAVRWGDLLILRLGTRP